ncbi:G2/mitotic-specific cyclin [Microbotryomycetes sp. JL221]|nr:G2/mitotic-specific cyclin [Microbotryomycetes sp. JL221]
MATRRTTRRSLAAAGTGIENDLGSSAQAGTSLVDGALARKPVLTTKPRTALGAKATNQVKTEQTSTAVTRKRSAFNDVTNGSKNKSSTGAATTTKPVATTTTVSSDQTKRTYRTRASLTGDNSSEIKNRVKQELSEGQQVDQDRDATEDNAMAVDDDLHVTVAAVPVARPVRNLKRTSTAVVSTSTATATANKDGLKAESSKAAVTQTRRAPLATKSTNANSRGSTAATTIVQGDKVSKATLAMRARRRREEAEQKQREAELELEIARREEEELVGSHRNKKARTSEPERYDQDDLKNNAAWFEAEVEETKDALARRPKDYGWEDLDEGDEEDPMMVSAYVVEVYEYLRELELKTLPNPDYMSDQNEVTWKMRGILIDWLVEIHTKFRLLPETIFLATNIIDRFLSERVVSLVKLQLVGVTALFIAAKYEEVVCPSVSNFLYMTDGGYTDDEILKAERYVLSMIDFNLSYPNPIHFLRRISKADDYDIQSRTMAKYLMEISIVDHRFMGTPPSLIAAAGAWLARKILDKGPWDANLIHYSGYSQDEIFETAQMMLDYLVRTSKSLTHVLDEDDALSNNPLREPNPVFEIEHPNFYKKYAAKKFFKASATCRQWVEDEFLEPDNGHTALRRLVHEPLLENVGMNDIVDDDSEA